MVFLSDAFQPLCNLITEFWAYFIPIARLTLNPVLDNTFLDIRKIGEKRKLVTFKDTYLSASVSKDRSRILSIDMVIEKGTFKNNQITFVPVLP